MAIWKTAQGVDARLGKIEGQIRGIRVMTRDGRECLDFVTQIAAVRGALKNVADLLAAEHLEAWASRVAPAADGDTQRQDGRELLKGFDQDYR